MGSFYDLVCKYHTVAMIEEALLKRSTSLNISHFGVTEVPDEMMKLVNLVRLKLHNNKLCFLPENVICLERLHTLTLDYNNIATLPENFGTLQNLVCLNLSHNPLKSLPAEIVKLPKLEVLWLNNTELETIPTTIRNLIHLDTFGARGNQISLIPEEISALTSLRWLTLEGNLITEIPSNFGALQKLIHLNLAKNLLQVFPAPITEIKTLQYCMLNGNNIIDVSFSQIQAMQNCKKIDLQFNPVTSLPWLKDFQNVIVEESTEQSNHDSESESEDWEDSVPSSEIDLSESSDEEYYDNDEVIAALPDIVQFTLMG